MGGSRPVRRVTDETYQQIRQFIATEAAKRWPPSELGAVRIVIELGRPDDRPGMEPGDGDRPGVLRLSTADTQDLEDRLAAEPPPPRPALRPWWMD